MSGKSSKSKRKGKRQTLDFDASPEMLEETTDGNVGEDGKNDCPDTVTESVNGCDTLPGDKMGEGDATADKSTIEATTKLKGKKAKEAKKRAQQADASNKEKEVCICFVRTSRS